MYNHKHLDNLIASRSKLSTSTLTNRSSTGHVFFGRGVGRPSTTYNYVWIDIPKYVLERKLGRSLRAGMQVNHLPPCDTESCIAEDHLYEGTKKQNYDDMKACGTILLGSKLSHAKLTEVKVREILRSLDSGATSASQARKYNVSCTTISRIARGITWTHVEEDGDDN